MYWYRSEEINRKKNTQHDKGQQLTVKQQKARVTVTQKNERVFIEDNNRFKIYIYIYIYKNIKIQKANVEI